METGKLIPQEHVLDNSCLVFTKQKHPAGAFPLVPRFPKTSLNFMTVQTAGPTRQSWSPRPLTSGSLAGSGGRWGTLEVLAARPADLPQVHAAASGRKGLGCVPLTLHASVAPVRWEGCLIRRLVEQWAGVSEAVVTEY